MEMVTIRTFDNYFSANIILSKLQNESIPCFLRDEHSATINPILGHAIGGIKLTVHTKDAELALRYLKQFDEDYLKTALCPQCLGHDFLVVPKRGAENMLTAVLMWMFSSYAASVENVYQCQQCGYESKTFPENKATYN